MRSTDLHRSAGTFVIIAAVLVGGAAVRGTPWPEAVAEVGLYATVLALVAVAAVAAWSHLRREES